MFFPFLSTKLESLRIFQNQQLPTGVLLEDQELREELEVLLLPGDY